MKIYSHQEDIIIIDHIIKNNLHNNVRGNKMWQQMEKDGILHRTWYSLKDHYKHVILNQLHCFKIPEEEKLKLKRGGPKTGIKNNQNKIQNNLEQYNREKYNDNAEKEATVIQTKRLSQNFLKCKTNDIESKKIIVHSQLTDEYECKMADSTTEWLCRSESSSVKNNFNKGTDDQMSTDSDIELDRVRRYDTLKIINYLRKNLTELNQIKKKSLFDKIACILDKKYSWMTLKFHITVEVLPNLDEFMKVSEVRKFYSATGMKIPYVLEKRLNAIESHSQSEEDSHYTLNEQINQKEVQNKFSEVNKYNSPLNKNIIEQNLDEESPVELHNVDEYNNTENMFEYTEMPLKNFQSKNNVNESQLFQHSNVLSDEPNSNVNEPDDPCQECTLADDTIKIIINNKTYRMVPKSTSSQKLEHIRKQFSDVIIIEDDEYNDLFMKKWFDDYFSPLFTNNMNNISPMHRYPQLKSDYIQKISKQLREISKEALAAAHLNFLDNLPVTTPNIISEKAVGAQGPDIENILSHRSKLRSNPRSVLLCDSSTHEKECNSQHKAFSSQISTCTSSALDKSFTKLLSNTCRTLLSEKNSIETNINLYPQIPAIDLSAISHSSDDIISLSDSDSSYLNKRTNCDDAINVSQNHSENIDKKKRKLNAMKQYNANVNAEFSYETFCSAITKNRDENQASTQASNLSSMSSSQGNCIKKQVCSEIPSSQYMSNFT